MSMFPKQKPQQPLPPGAVVVPQDAKQSYVVKYHGGRKPFDIRADADDFANECREAPKGWAEVIRQIEIVVSPRS